MKEEGGQGEGRRRESVLLEEREGDEILLGAGVVQPAVEEWLREVCRDGVPPSSPLVTMLRGCYLGGGEVMCELSVRVGGVEPPAEVMFELSQPTSSGGQSHGEARSEGVIGCDCVIGTVIA